MQAEYEKGRSALEAMIERDEFRDEGRNEAATRLHLIDELLFSCLGWDRRDCDPEERTTDGTYIDYRLGNPIPQLIVEAKKEGETFWLPAGTTTGRIQLPTLLREKGAVGAAIRQAMKYSHDSGIAPTVVANGHQLVAFLASRTDSIEPAKGTAFVFASPDEMLESFSALWDFLSPAGLRSHRLQVHLQRAAAPSPPGKLSARITGFPGFRNRNPLQVHLKHGTAPTSVDT